MPSPKGLTPEQRVAIAELLVSAKRFWLAPPGIDEEQAVARLTAAGERFMKALDDE